MASEVTIKWDGQEITIPVDPEDTVGSLKEKLADITKVAVSCQKLLGLKAKGSLAKDDMLMADIKLKPRQKILMMGSPQEVIENTEKQAEEAIEISDDFDEGQEEMNEIAVKDQPEVQQKLYRRIESVTVEILHAPRKGKKLLVLDIDYTIFDLGSSAESPQELARPYLHEFMEACYENFDLIIWSATSMKWVQVKMKELGVSNNPNYNLVCMLDHAAMVTVYDEDHGLFDCKPLAFIWAKFPGVYDETNTVMLDDLSRNFIMNKQNGLKIRPYRKCHRNRNSDRELLGLKEYFNLIGSRNSLSDLNHKKWESYVANHYSGR